ncbi:hypothetical protein AAVH_42631, partial [Aphelenchoides avenae]
GVPAGHTRRLPCRGLSTGSRQHTERWQFLLGHLQPCAEHLARQRPAVHERTSSDRRAESYARRGTNGP